MAFKRYKRQSDGVLLLGELIHLKAKSLSGARQTLVRLLEARFGDQVEVGVTLECVSILRRDAPDTEVDELRRTLAQRLRDDAKARVTGGSFVSQGVLIDQALIGRANGGIAISLSGELVHLLAAQMFLLVNFVTDGSVEECSCGQLFVRFGKKQACSTRCYKRRYMDDYRKGKRRRKGEPDGKTSR